jgi:hypothetical protein
VSVRHCKLSVRERKLTNFREGNELATGLTSLVDEVDGLANTALKVEPLDVVS